MYSRQEHGQPLAVYEHGAPLWRRTEQSLGVWWFQQAERVSELITTEGERLIILAAGELNDGPGPDVKQAHLILGDLECSGAVEFHQHSQDWFRHGHHLDPAYEEVILHLVYEAGEGPDIPTLVAPGSYPGSLPCIAVRPVSVSELLEAAWQRLNSKVWHLQELEAHVSADLSVLFLGLLEILCAGPRRASQLQHLAAELGLEAWPHIQPWRGSQMQYPRSSPIGLPWQPLLEQPQLFSADKWEPQCRGARWDWSAFSNPFQAWGVSQLQFQEWVVNILAPSWPAEQGFDLWQSLPPFRQYGFEPRIRRRLLLPATPSIAVQQALICWERRMCRSDRCPECPLRRYH